MAFQLKHYKMKVFETIFLLLFHLKNSFLHHPFIIFITYKNFNLDDFTNGNNKDHNKKWPYIPDHPYRMLIIGGSGSGKINVLLNLIKEQDSDNLIDKIYLYAEDLNVPKCQFLIKKCEDVGIKHLNNPKAFIEY